MQYRVFLAAVVLSTAVQAGEVEEPATVQIPAERMKECIEGGGCAFITRAEFAAAMVEAFAAGERHAYVTCGSRTGARE